VVVSRDSSVATGPGLARRSSGGGGPASAWCAASARWRRGFDSAWEMKWSWHRAQWPRPLLVVVGSGDLAEGVEIVPVVSFCSFTRIIINCNQELGKGN
jgi:hypothetical protein